jgi:hypothetical protein
MPDPLLLEISELLLGLLAKSLNFAPPVRLFFSLTNSGELPINFFRLATL